MRDFSKPLHKKAMPPRHRGKSTRQRSSGKLRKGLLALLLFFLMLAFIISLFHRSRTNLAPSNVQKTQALAKSTKQSAIARPAALAHEKTALNTRQAKGTDQKSTAMQAPAKEASASRKQPLQFTFYDTLTKKTVQVDVKPKPVKQYLYTYMLQVGSYRSKTDANAVRAKLILAGLTPTITRVGNWYRVDVGPVNSKREGDVIKHKVEKAGISGSILRQTGKQERPPKAASASNRSAPQVG